MKIKIVIPPCVTSRPAFNFGQAINFVYADVISKYYRKLGDVVEFTPYSWNNHARRTEEINPDLKTYEEYLDLSRRIYGQMEQGLKYIGIFSSDGRYLDTDVQQQQITKEALIRLSEKGFIRLEGDGIFLDVPEIVRRTNVLDMLNSTNFVPDSQKRLVLNIVRNNQSFQLNCNSIFATDLPVELGNSGLLGKIKPVFNLYFSPFFLTPGIPTHVVNGRCSTTRYIIDGFLISSALREAPFCYNVDTYPIVRFGKDEANIADLVTKFGSGNVIRYAAIKCVNRTQDLGLDPAFFSAGKRLLDKLKNLEIFMKKNYSREILSDGKTLRIVDLFFRNHNIRGALEAYEQEVLQLSRDIDRAKSSSLDDVIEELSARFLEIRSTKEIFFSDYL